MFYTKSCSLNFCNIKRKIPEFESLLNKASGLEACNFIKETPTQVFYFEYCGIFKNNYSEEHLRISSSIPPENIKKWKLKSKVYKVA